MEDRGPSSPCINVCTLDEQGVCRGCFRTLTEIAGWSGMAPGEQWIVIERADRRRQQLHARRSE